MALRAGGFIGRGGLGDVVFLFENWPIGRFFGLILMALERAYLDRLVLGREWDDGLRGAAGRDCVLCHCQATQNLLRGRMIELPRKSLLPATLCSCPLS